MSSRALRRLQKEQELQKQLAASRASDEDKTDDEDVEDEATTLPPSNALNAFDMLDGADLGDSEEDVEEDKPTLKPKDSDVKILPTSTPGQSSKSKKKKKKPKKKAKEKVAEPTVDKKEGGIDEIDRALKELSAKDAQKQQDLASGGGMERSDSHAAAATKLLGIESKNLNPLNEMKSLFGNIALEGSSDSRSSPRTQRRREQNQQGGVDLATALMGRHSPASKNKDLGALASRRNVFMQGKEEWPLSTSGGLSMERNANASTFEKTYSIIHNSVYQETQRHFRICVDSMEPQNMISLLMQNPYHIATLLQVSEIAKHQGDHSVSGDLLERALFSIGRSVHSTFPAALREGSARLAFEKPENRDLYLSIWRYIRNLEMRGTWRTAFEWAKILLQLDPRSDPYGVTLMIDQLALRGRQNAALIELCSDEAYGLTWAHLPNVQISLALAYQRSSQPKQARETLAVAMHKYPYVLSALASALDIAPIPSSLWGKLPSTDAEKLYTELYITRAKDLWNTPETTSLIVEVAETLDHYSGIIKSSSPAAKLEISLEEARHIMLLEIPQLIAFLPRRFTNMPTSSSDVLPPPYSLSEFTARAPGDGSGAGAMRAIINVAGGVAGVPITGANGVITRVMEWFSRPAEQDEARNENGESEGQAAFRQLNDEFGGEYPPHMIEEILRQSMGDQFRGSMMDQVTEDERDEQRFGQGPLFGTGMPRSIGDFDYYREGAERSSVEESSDGDDHEGSMPRLESIPDETVESQVVVHEARNPHSAFVEEDEEDGDASTVRPTRSAGRSILRHIDSDDEEDDSLFVGRVGQPPPHFAPARFPTSSPLRTESSPEQPQSQADPLSSDPQRVQRWLLTSGLTNLHNNPESMVDYIQKLKGLRKQQQEWVVSMVRQRAGEDVAQRVIAKLER